MGKRYQNCFLNPFTPKSDLIDFTLSNARQFYSSKGNPLGVKGLTPERYSEFSLDPIMWESSKPPPPCKENLFLSANGVIMELKKLIE